MVSELAIPHKHESEPYERPLYDGSAMFGWPPKYETRYCCRICGEEMFPVYEESA